MPASAPRQKPSVPAAPPDIAADFAPLLAERHMALAVSGGSDSTALMCLAVDWARTNHPDLALTVLTVDHRLRSEAAEEAAMVGSWAAGFGLPHHVLPWGDEPKPATGIQAAARAARYGLMSDWCRNNGATALLTAHTLDDQAETVLMRLSRTTSPESLAGIRTLGSWDGLPILRPLLGEGASITGEARRRHDRAAGRACRQERQAFRASPTPGPAVGFPFRDGA